MKVVWYLDIKEEEEEEEVPYRWKWNVLLCRVDCPRAIS